MANGNTTDPAEDDVKGAEATEEPAEDADANAEAPEAEPAEDDVKDSHGQPGINKERHDREVAALNAKIAELQGKIDEAAETKKGREELEKQIEVLKTDMADNDLSHRLESAGCLDAKAAKARLDDFDGDVDKLKEECPYLFAESKKKGSTGLKPAGATDGLDEKLDKAFGIK